MGGDTLVSPPRRSRRGRRALKIALLAGLLVIAAALSLFAGAYVSVARTLPSVELAGRIASPQATRIYDASPTPVLLAELHGPDSRDVLAAEDIPQVMRDAVVAIEEPRFYEHKGVDFFAILRAAWANLRNREVALGGSAITQQLIKNAFLTDEQAAADATREPRLAYELESRWTKQKILTEYLNVIYFGSSAYGIQAGARSYFGVDAKQLSLAQAALLAGLIDAPSAYSPRRDPKAALARRDLVLNKMYQQRYISSQQLQEALEASPQFTDAGAEDPGKEPSWVELVREQLVAHYGSSTALGGGLSVYTSLDTRVQQAAEDAITAVLGDATGTGKTPAAALVAIDVHTGSLVAMVGGFDPATPQSNLATQARWKTGSAFMPFALVAALEQGISPEATYDSGPATLTVSGSEREVPSTDVGPASLAKGMAEASDGVMARLMAGLSVDSLAQAANGMGIVSPLGEPLSPALALWGPDGGVTPLEMAMAYATLAANGERLSPLVTFDASKAGYPVTVQRVTDSAGQLLDQNGIAGTRVIDAGLAQLATSCLQAVITSGTGRAAAIGRPAAGETGTSEDERSAWFVGYTPDLVAAVWVGYPPGQTGAGDDLAAGLTPVSGSTFPAWIWSRFMESVLAGTEPSDFPTDEAAQWVSVSVCTESMLLPTELCPNVAARLFRVDKVPTDTCDIHVPRAALMPNVVGMSITKAKKVLGQSNLKVRTVTDNNSLQSAGTVTKQDCTAGKPILQGSTVTLRVSSGQGAAVPKLVDLSVEEAQTLLTGAGLTADTAQQPSDAVPAGVVMSQDPAAGAVVSKGTTIHIVVSSGPAAPPST
jgi:penicillin-binding protein 1A